MNREDEGMTDKEYFESLPPGFRFSPLDDELIEVYLTRKLKNLDLPRNRIHEVEFSKERPETLIDSFVCTFFGFLFGFRNYEAATEGMWYFFSPMMKKYPNGGRPDRQAQGGFWKITSNQQSVFRQDVDGGKTKVGFKTCLDFYRGERDDEDNKTDWKIHEYKTVAQYSHALDKRNRDSNSPKVRTISNNNM
ncbi:hypothetical protein Tsubulata_047050 [Turnera subulata]|uniref:NAC domain-containing protein n=1 Tax=Turnera subulata TaxID=218843 RepID=A0A9Q0G7R3_9ROSI|nr:hypothetical protein Tsubulata_047050 [Turnera subulata]